jgi:hypothetical protein
MAKRKTQTGDGDDTQRLTVYLPRELHLTLMRKALDETEAAGQRVSATQIVERLIAQYVGRKGGRQ